MPKGMNFYLRNVSCPRCENESNHLEIHYSPGEDAYPTSNPDHPSYGDPGCDAECEIVGASTTCVGKCGFDFASEEFAEELLIRGSECLDSAIEDDAERRAMDRWDRDD